MEGEVFVYFVSIGAGVSFGLSIGAIPAVIVWRWMKRKENDHGVYAKKASSRA